MLFTLLLFSSLLIVFLAFGEYECNYYLSETDFKNNYYIFMFVLTLTGLSNKMCFAGFIFKVLNPVLEKRIHCH